MTRFKVGDYVCIAKVDPSLVCKVTEVVDESLCRVVGVDYPTNDPMLISQSALLPALNPHQADKEFASTLALVEESYMRILDYPAN